MSKTNRRYIRTVILAVLAMSSLIWVAIEQFEIPAADMLILFCATVIGAAAIIAFAALAVTVLNMVRKLNKQKRD